MRPLLSSDLGGEADSVTFFGLVRVVGGCLLLVETSEWSVTGSSSGMAGSRVKWPLCDHWLGSESEGRGRQPEII